MSAASRRYAVTFTTGSNLQLNMDIDVIADATIEETIGQILKAGIWGDRGQADPSARWMIPGSQIARVDWHDAPAVAFLAGLAADPNGGPGDK